MSILLSVTTALISLGQFCESLDNAEIMVQFELVFTEFLKLGEMILNYVG